MDAEGYCRDLESYLCRKNDGHLVRIVGPAFERVSEWARRGIPLTVAQAGIDRYFERYYRQGPRRRPVRVEFCEPDVLDAFDTWRRAVGVAPEVEGAARPKRSLATHLESVVARLTMVRASSPRAARFAEHLDAVARELDACLPAARAARGSAREQVLDRVAAIDRSLMESIWRETDEATRAAARTVAVDELAPFRDRLSPDARNAAERAAAERYLRDQLGLPVITFE